jgi:GR25 family glycosyltransferase involved in LPS biosynthesis
MMQFEDYVDLVCYVNLDRRPEKRDFMERQLEREGIVAHRIAGVDAEKPLPGKIRPVSYDDNGTPHHPDSRAGMLGCLYSMGMAMSLAKISGAKSMLYLEDDAVLCSDFKARFVEAMEHCPDNYHAVNFGGWHIEEPQRLNDWFGRVKLTLNAHCILFNQSAYNMIIESTALKTDLADHQLVAMKNIRYLACTRLNIPQMTGYSDTINEFLGSDRGRFDIDEWSKNQQSGE